MISHLNYVLGGVDLLQAGNSVRSSLSGSVLCSRQNISEFLSVTSLRKESVGNSPSREGDRDAGLLDWAGLLPPFLENTHQQFPLQTKVLKLVALRVRHVGGLLPPVLGRQLQLALPPVQVLNLR